MWLWMLWFGCAAHSPPAVPRALPGAAAQLSEPGPSREPSVTLGTVRVPNGPLSSTDVHVAVQSSLPGLESCYLRELLRSPGLEGWLDTTLLVGGGGNYQEALTDRASPGIDALGTCLRFVWMDTAFPSSPSGAESTIRVQLTFDDGDDSNED